jgi:hypothetical protein
MSKQEALMCYKTAMCIFRNWAAKGVITADELRQIEAVLARKYGLSFSSLYRENDLLCAEIRANIV